LAIKNYTAVRSREIKKSLSRKKESFSREEGELFPGKKESVTEAEKKKFL
jgi:hypothetical protein